MDWERRLLRCRQLQVDMSSQRKEEAGISAEHVFAFSLLLDELELYGPGAAASTCSLVLAIHVDVDLRSRNVPIAHTPSSELTLKHPHSAVLETALNNPW
jgi:hypothetical protein